MILVESSSSKATDKADSIFYNSSGATKVGDNAKYIKIRYWMTNVLWH